MFELTCRILLYYCLTNKSEEFPLKIQPLNIGGRFISEHLDQFCG